MGHIGQLRHEYRDLLARLDAGPATMPEPTDPKAWEGWRQILEILFTPEDAATASRMPVRPATLDEVATRFGSAPEETEARLDALCRKGIVMDLRHPDTGRVRYLLAPAVVGFFEFAFMRAHEEFPRRKLAEAMDAYMQGDVAFAAEVFGTETVLGRALVHEDHLAEGALPDVLDWERASELVSQAKLVAVTLCYCRHKKEHLGEACDAPQDICLSLDVAADYLTRRGYARAVSNAAGLDKLREARDHGLVQLSDNVRDRPAWICNCCSCCCAQLNAITTWEMRAVNPSGFEPWMDPDKCKGCSRCARACPVTAISMQSVRVAHQRKNTLRPVVDLERCIGCGVCAAACKTRSVTMVRRAQPSHVPATPLERVLRATLEKGRLPHLLFDQGESRGAQFLNRAMQTLMKMPLADRLLASEQAQSRFVAAALRNVKDPTSD